MIVEDKISLAESCPPRPPRAMLARAAARCAVAVLSKADRSGGGASLIAEQTAALLADAGCRADHWAGSCGRAPGANFRLLPGRGSARFVRRLHWLTRQFGLPDVVPWEYPLLRRRLAEYDVLHFHDISSAISPLTVRWLARRKPVVWTFHDCSPFTGGCLYPLGCEAFQRRCGRCPQLHVWPLAGRWPLDFTGPMQDVKRRTAAEARFAAIAPSQWMADEALRSGMFVRPPRVIPYAVDSATFCPRDRATLRRELGLPPEGFWALIAAGALTDARKGTAQAVEAVRRCGRPVAALLVGRENPTLRAALGDTPVHCTGFIDDRQQLARYYAAADVLLFPSLADNLPCTIQETMACGTPTVGFRTGGVPELVEHLATGHLSPPGDVAGLTAGLQLAVDRPELRRQWAEAGRCRALDRYAPARYVQAHLELYAEIIAS